MAATDISTTKGKGINRTPFNFQTPYETRVYDITPVSDGVTTPHTHTLATIEIGKALVGFKLIFLTTVTASATLTFTAGTALSGALTGAGTAAGMVHAPPLSLIGATTGTFDGYADAAIPVTMAVGTTDVAAGRFLMILDLVDVAATTTNG